ncbi:uncharacterized protein LOC132309508 [Cornus florida]|uniref:uncharacterized protein LOC132309508 n=1 Tax=Cornus florida TaxID=4283 RepID=UPI002896CA75|nr:uncharacterized protein LOC132309508 [Cornus florida]
MVIVENERWTKLIKVNSQYGKYRKKPCNHFDKLTTIFGGTHATGAHVHTFYSPLILNQAPAHHEGTHASFDLNDDFAELGGHEFTPSPDPRGKKPRRESFASTMDGVMEKMSEACREKTDRIERAIVASSSSNMKTVHEAGQIDIRTIIDLYDDGDEENECVIIMACCVGVIDGTHVHANVPVDQQIPFRGRKGDTTQNVMAVCDFDMMFTYVVAGWEGFANDSKMLNETINNEDLHFPMPPKGKYYLVDFGYANQLGFLASYRGQRYHFQEYRRAHRQPQGREEIYNHRHSSLQNIIERCFGMLKMRFPILKQMPPYKFEAQVAIVLTCCTLHNFISKEAHVDPIFNDVTVEVMIDEIFGDDEVDVQPNVSQSRSRPMDIVRDYIANTIWIWITFAYAVMYKIQGDGPPCACGRGRMNLYTAGTSKNYGRSFYRCPAWESHDRAFTWLDDMHQRLQLGGHV